MKNISDYQIDYHSAYFYDFLVYKDWLNKVHIDNFLDLKKVPIKSIETYLGISTGVSSPDLEEITRKNLNALFIEYLLTVRSDRNILEGMCFYYDSNNLTFSFATFDENNNLVDSVINNGSFTDIKVDINANVWIDYNNKYVIDNSLKSPLAYLGKLVETVWNVFPDGLKIVFISIFTITLIFMFLRMVGWYG